MIMDKRENKVGIFLKFVILLNDYEFIFLFFKYKNFKRILVEYF